MPWHENWFIKRFAVYNLFPDYFRTIRHTWVDVAWGAGVPAVAFIIPWSLGYDIPRWAIALFFVWALVVAGYHSWRVDHIRLMPRLSVTTLCAPNKTPTEDRNTTSLYIQIIPECLTDAPVHGCRARLLQVSKRFEESDDWELTAMDSPLFLGWDYYGSEELTLEPGVKQRLNVCWWSNRFRMVIPAVDPLPSRFRDIFNDLDTFKFDILFTAPDCQPVAVSVLVSLRNRGWDNPIISLMQGHGNATKQ